MTGSAPRRRPVGWRVALAALALLLAACRTPDAGGRPWNVVVILVDTLRADHLGLYGYGRPTSPALDGFARDAIVFANATSQAGCTFPSVNSLLTARYPQLFLGQGEGRIGIPEAIPTLPEILRQQGYSTAAVSASRIVRRTPSRFNRYGGFGRGFDLFDETCARQPAACVNDRALGILPGLEEPFFLYLHYMEPHAPYKPPPEHPRAFVSGSSGKRWVDRGDTEMIKRKIYGGRAEIEISDRDLAHLIALYDEEILYFDRQLDVLLGFLDRTGMIERTIVALLSDHGEEILDHGQVAHCRDLAYQTILWTPLVLKIPGVGGSVRSSLVQNLDLLPTLLDYLGIAYDLRGLDGISLRPVIDSDRPIHRYSFASQGRSRTVRDGRLKAIYHLGNGALELFDLGSDPAELNDLASARPAVAAELLNLLGRWISSVEGGDRDASVESAREAEELLRAVGYL